MCFPFFSSLLNGGEGEYRIFAIVLMSVEVSVNEKNCIVESNFLIVYEPLANYWEITTLILFKYNLNQFLEYSFRWNKKLSNTFSDTFRILWVLSRARERWKTNEMNAIFRYFIWAYEDFKFEKWGLSNLKDAQSWSSEEIV